jgi:hypothetical protein
LPAPPSLLIGNFATQLEKAHIAPTVAFLLHHARIDIAAVIDLEPVPNGAMKFLASEWCFYQIGKGKIFPLWQLRSQLMDNLRSTGKQYRDFW